MNFQAVLHDLFLIRRHSVVLPEGSLRVFSHYLLWYNRVASLRNGMATYSINVHRLEFTNRLTRLVVVANGTAASAYRLDDEDNSVSIELVGSHYQVMEAKPIKWGEPCYPFDLGTGDRVQFTTSELHGLGLIDQGGHCEQLAVKYDPRCGPLRISTPRRTINHVWINPFDRKCMQVESS